MVKRLCACGCRNQVTQRTESRHLNGQGPLFLASSVLSQSRSLAQRRKSSHRPANQELVGRLGPLQPAVDSRPASVNSPPPIYLDDGDFPMGEAGPSGVDHDTTQPTHANAAGNHDDYGLSKLRRSHRIADYVDQVGRQRWGSNHVRQFILDEESDEEEDKEESDEEEEQLSDEEDYLGSLEQDDEYAILGAEPGQEGVSVWDLLGEGFLQEASKLGLSLYYYCTAG